MKMADWRKWKREQRKTASRDWLKATWLPLGHAQSNGSPECIASPDKDEERAGSGAFTKMESEREQSKRFALDKLLFLCCWSRFCINVLLYQVSVLFKSRLGDIEGASCRVDSRYFCLTFSTVLRLWDSVAIFSFPFKPFSSTFFAENSIFNSLISLWCFHCSWITRYGERNICCPF